jgi:hypothetical protein
MSNEYSILNLSKLSKPVNTLIEKISDAVGGLLKPWQIKRVAKAEGEAVVIQATAEARIEVIKVQTSIELSEIEKRGLVRMAIEEGQKQVNMEDIIKKAIPKISTNAQAEQLEKDWLVYFFGRVFSS